MSLLRNVLRAIKDHPERTEDILDSFSDNQYLSKQSLLESLESNGLIHSESEIVILGSWYGSILIEYLAPLVKKITAMDIDDETIIISKTFFKHYNNIDWITADVFHDVDRSIYEEATLIINTSCEHMEDMVKWDQWEFIAKDNPGWDQVKRNFDEFPLYLAFQSNNMFGIEGHINCVNNIDEFKNKLPQAFWIDEKTIKDERGSRFMLIGEFLDREKIIKIEESDD